MGSQGIGVTFFPNLAAIKQKHKEFFPCGSISKDAGASHRALVQEYIKRPLLVKRSKFDARVYMFVASSDPWIVFYHQGYLRRSLAPYDANSRDRKVYLTNTHFQSMRKGFKLSDHIWSFKDLGEYLWKRGRTGRHYVSSVLDPYIKQVALFVFHSAKARLKRRKGSFHIFGLDFMIDSAYRVHFIEVCRTGILLLPPTPHPATASHFLYTCRLISAPLSLLTKTRRLVN